MEEIDGNDSKIDNLLNETIKPLKNKTKNNNTVIIKGNSRAQYYELKPNGIYLIKEEGSGDCYERPIYVWDAFIITHIIKDESDRERTTRYSGIIDKFEFNDWSIEDIKKRLIAEGHLQAKRPEKDMLDPIIREYCKKFQIPQKSLSKRCGFTKERGWVLPDNNVIQTNDGIQKRCLSSIEKMCNLTIKPDRLKKRMNEAYDTFITDHKDLIFAWAFAAPFFDALKPHTHLSPWIAVGGQGLTGKTSILSFLTSKFWNNLAGQEVIDGDHLKSNSQLMDYFSHAAFAILLDDCQDMTETTLSAIKSFLTNESDFERKNPDNTIRFKRPLQAPIAMDYNTLPLVFDDDAFKLRGFNIIAKHTANLSDHRRFDEFNQKYSNLDFGSDGKYFYDYTKLWDYEKIIDIYSGMDDNPKADQARDNTIYKLMGLGKYVAKELYNLDIEIKALPDILFDTKQLGNDELIDTFFEQVKYATDYNLWDNRYDHDGNIIGRKCQKDWIKTEIDSKIYQGMDGFIYKVENLNDLQTRLPRNPKYLKLSLQKLGNILNMRNNRIQTIQHYDKQNRTNARGIFIPKPNPTDNLSGFVYDSSKKRNLTNTIMDKIKEIVKAHQTFSIEDIYEPLSTYDGISENFVKESIENWCNDGTIHRKKENNTFFLV